MISAKKNRLLYYILIAVAVLLIYMLRTSLKENSTESFTSNNNDIKNSIIKNNPEAGITIPSNNTLKITKKMSDQNTKQKVAITTNELEVTTGLDEAEKDSIFSWQESRGYFRPETIAQYNAYSEATLEALAAQGDICALQIISNIWFLDGRNQESLNALNEAAARGSIQALFRISSRMESNMLSQNNELLKKELGYKSLAYMQIANMRGDKMIDDSIMSTFKSMNNFDVDPDDQKIIDEYAKSIYLSLENYRTEIGLGEFDNSLDPNVEKLYKLSGKK